MAVVAGPYEQWPLPWYLRRMTRVGYWTSLASVPVLDHAPVVIASSGFASGVETALGERHVSEFCGLRPDVLLTAFIERGLWDHFLASQASGTDRR